MRKSNTERINNIVDQVLKDLNIDTKLKEARLINSWQEVVGKTINSYTEKLSIKKRILYVRLNSSVVRNELYMLKDQLTDRLNEKAGDKIIDEIKLS